MLVQNKDDMLPEILDRVRHRGLPEIRKEVCSICTEEADLLRDKAREYNFELVLVPRKVK